MGRLLMLFPRPVPSEPCRGELQLGCREPELGKRAWEHTPSTAGEESRNARRSGVKPDPQTIPPEAAAPANRQTGKETPRRWRAGRLVGVPRMRADVAR